MIGKRVGYIRVSSLDQNPERQLEGIQLDKTFIDKASGKDVKRPALGQLLSYVREDDTVVVHSMDRLARNLDDLRRIVQNLNNQNIKVHFIKESLIFTGDDTPISKLLLCMLGSVAEFERELIKERQKEGIALAKARGVYSKGRKQKLNNEQIAEINKLANLGVPKVKLAKDFGVSRRGIYNILK